MWKEQSTSYQDADKPTTDENIDKQLFKPTDNQNHHHHHS